MRKFDGKKNTARREALEDGFNQYQELTFSVWRKTALTYAVQVNEDFEVDTLEGLHTGKAGDYLAVGPHGEMYPIDLAVFEASYETAEDA